MPRDVGVLLVAAGRGERAGGGEPKQFRPIAGTPMLLRALRPFSRHPEVGPIVIALPGEAAASPPEWLAAIAGDRVTLVAGGTSRRESVARALAALDPSAVIVLVHDAARPFVGGAVIDGVIAAARAGEGAVAALPLGDTLKRTDHAGVITDTVPRDGLWRAQTPQGFPRAMLVAAHATPGTTDATDDAVLAESLGHRVRVVPDSPRNFKVTSADDFALAEAIAGRMP